MIPNGCLLMAVSLKLINMVQGPLVTKMNRLGKVGVETQPRFILQYIAADYRFTLNYREARSMMSVSQNLW